jgi:hypothetical protein
MPKDDAMGGGKGGADEALLDFEFEDLKAGPMRKQVRREPDDDIIELINPVKRGESADDILEGISGLEYPPGGPAKDTGQGVKDLGPFDKEIEAIFSRDEAPFVSPFTEVPPTQGPKAAAPETVPLQGISEERLEAMISKAIGEAVERVAGRAIEAAAEKAIREAIDALRESLKVPRG